MLERDVTKKAVDYAEKVHGLRHIRLHLRPGVKRGWPDHIFLIPNGRPLMMEFKATGKKPSPLQKERISTLVELGYDVCVCDSPDTAREAIARAVDTARLSASRD